MHNRHQRNDGLEFAPNRRFDCRNIFSEKNKINEIHGNLLFPRERHHDAKSVIIVCLKLAVMD